MNYDTKENEPVFETSAETGEKIAVYEESAELEYLLVEKEDGEF